MPRRKRDETVVPTRALSELGERGLWTTRTRWRGQRIKDGGGMVGGYGKGQEQRGDKVERRDERGSIDDRTREGEAGICDNFTVPRRTASWHSPIVTMRNGVLHV